MKAIRAARRWCLAVFAAAAMTLMLPQPAFPGEGSKPEIVVVYWSSQDCKWCTWWESGMSGMEKSLRQSEEFKLIKYRVVKNKYLATPYAQEDFPSDIQWVYELLQKGEKPTGRPGWAVYVNKKRVASFYGTSNWESKTLPGLKRVIAEHARS